MGLCRSAGFRRAEIVAQTVAPPVTSAPRRRRREMCGCGANGRSHPGSGPAGEYPHGGARLPLKPTHECDAQPVVDRAI